MMIKNVASKSNLALDTQFFMIFERLLFKRSDFYFTGVIDDNVIWKSQKDLKIK